MGIDLDERAPKTHTKQNCRADKAYVSSMCVLLTGRVASLFCCIYPVEIHTILSDGHEPTAHIRDYHSLILHGTTANKKEIKNQYQAVQFQDRPRLHARKVLSVLFLQIPQELISYCLINSASLLPSALKSSAAALITWYRTL